MRTTITLEDSLIQAIKKKSTELNIPLKVFINQLLQRGLQDFEKSTKNVKPYRLKSKSLKPMSGYDLDRLSKILDEEDVQKIV